MIRGDSMALLKMNLLSVEKFSESQEALISLAKEYGQDTSILRNTDFSIRQLRCLIQARKEGIDVVPFANPGITYYTMLLIVQCAKRNIDYSPLLQVQLNQSRASAIYYNLTQGLTIKGNESEDELFDNFEIATGISRKECQIPIFIGWAQSLSEILFNSQVIQYRNKLMEEYKIYERI